MKTKRTILITLAMAVLLLFNSHDAFCRWPSQSAVDSGSSDNTALFVVTGVVLTGAIVYLIAKKKKAKGNASNIFQNDFNQTSSMSFYSKMKSASDQSPVELFAGNSQLNNQFDYGNFSRFSVGLRFKFGKSNPN